MKLFKNVFASLAIILLVIASLDCAMGRRRRGLENAGQLRVRRSALEMMEIPDIPKEVPSSEFRPPPPRKTRSALGNRHSMRTEDKPQAPKKLPVASLVSRVRRQIPTPMPIPMPNQ